MLSKCESTTSQYYVMYGAGAGARAVFFFRLRQKSAKEPAPAPQRCQNYVVFFLNLHKISDFLIPLKSHFELKNLNPINWVWAFFIGQKSPLVCEISK